MKQRKKFLSMALLALLIVSLITTSVGGAYASSVMAAEPGSTEAVSDGSDKGVIGLVALGLLAVLAKRGHDSTPDTVKQDAPKTSTAPSAQADSQTKPTTASQPDVVQSATPKPAVTPAVPSTQPSTGGLTADEAKAIDLLNADRRANGLPSLKVNLELTRLAERYAEDMINRKYFSHYNPEGQSPFDRMKAAGIKYIYAGENLAINSSVAGAEKAFMNSPGHRANILNKNYTEVGIGVRYAPNGSVYVVQEFIGR